MRFPHLAAIESSQPQVGWFEFHAENLFGLAPAMQRRLERLRADYPFSLHAVGLSIGSVDGIDSEHLLRLAEVVNLFEPGLVSEHLCWNRVAGVSVPDLLPLPMTHEALDTVAANVCRIQDVLGREIAVENISSYLRFEHGAMDEAGFLGGLVSRTGCKLLVDLNNLHVNHLNFGEDPGAFLRSVPASAVVEYHLAGPEIANGAWLDTHSTPVPDQVWSLYEEALALLGPRPTLIEWDQELPAVEVLVAESMHADRLLASAGRSGGEHAA
ncbi:MAG: DUF692 domain-containing protein [Pseudomonadota bacterium]|nr:DUF692 domain-containing protein [Pseudomonadota bacterium]